MADVKVIIKDETGGISQKGFGLPLVFDPTANLNYTEVSKTAEIPQGTGDLAKRMINAVLGQEPSPEKVGVYGIDLATAGTSVADELDKMMNKDFYFLLLASRKEGEVVSAANWANVNEKLFVTQNDITVSVDAIVSLAENLNSTRTALFAHKNGAKIKDENGTEITVDPCLDGAIVGRIAPIQAGAATWKFKKLNGIPLAGYTTAEISKLHGANINTYVQEMGQLQTSEGKSTAGSFLDIQRAKDWLKSRIKENIFQLLHNADKVPYDDNGIAQIVSRLKMVLKTAVNRGVIAKDQDGNGMWKINTPLRADIDVNSISERRLPDIKFTAVVAGAVHNVEVEGCLTTNEEMI